MNLTTTAIIGVGDHRTLGSPYIGGPGGLEDLVFQYLAPNAPQPIFIPITYVDNTVFLIGDLDFDGDIDGQDWVKYATGLGVDTTEMTTFQAWQTGDMNSDGINNHADFLLVKQAFEQQNGSGSFEAMLANVPEPASLTLLVGLSAMLLKKQR